MMPYVSDFPDVFIVICTNMMSIEQPIALEIQGRVNNFKFPKFSIISLHLVVCVYGVSGASS